MLTNNKIVGGVHSVLQISNFTELSVCWQLLPTILWSIQGCCLLVDQWSQPLWLPIQYIFTYLACGGRLGLIASL